MANSLYMEIDRMCMAIKHGGDVDLGEVRTLLRKAQAVTEILDSLSFLEGLHVESKTVDQYVEFHVQINATLTREQVENVLVYMSGHWDDDYLY